MRYLKYARWALYPFVIWIALALIYLEVPSIEQLDDEVFFAEELHSGNPILRVYQTADFIPREHRLPRVRRRTHAALRFAYDGEHNVLHIGNEPVFIPTLALAETSESRTPLLAPIAKLGDVDAFSPPWFPASDAVLLYSSVSQEWGRLLVTAERVPSPIGGEISLRIVAADRPVSWMDDPDDQPAVPLDMPPLATFHFRISPSLNPRLQDITLVRVTFPPLPFSSSPSRMYFARKVLLSVLAPTAILFIGLAELMGQLVKLAIIAVGVAAVLWIAREFYAYRRDTVAMEMEEGRRQESIMLRNALSEILGPTYAGREARSLGAAAPRRHTVGAVHEEQSPGSIPDMTDRDSSGRTSPQISL